MSRNLVVFLIACALGVGSILVYAKNNMDSANKNDPQNLTAVSSDPTATPMKQVDPVSFDQTNQKVAGASDQIQGANNQPKQNSQSQSQPQSQPQQQHQAQDQESLPTGPITQLMIKDRVVGNGEAVKDGDSVSVHYNGTFLDGSKFDSSYDRGQPFTFTVGAGSVIRGWDLGLVGMKAGGKRQLIIPSDLGYGAAGAPGAIPPNTPLVFEIELVSIQ